MLCSCKPQWHAPEPVSMPEVTLPDTVRKLSVEEASALIASTPGLRILDLRMEEELARDGRFPKAAHVDFFHHARLAEHLAALEKDAPCLILCALGGRAEKVVGRMHAAGFTRLHLLEGGIEAWIKAGQAMEK